MTSIQNVELPMSLLGDLKGSEIHKRAIELLTSVGLQDRMDHLPSELSGGEQVGSVVPLEFNSSV